MRVKFTVPGRPVPLSRPRRGKYGNFYTPKRSLEYQRRVHLFAKQAGLEKTDRYIWIKAYFYRSDKRRTDVDNLLKGLLDGLRYFFDDSQVIGFEAGKRECRKGEERTEVEIWMR